MTGLRSLFQRVATTLIRPGRGGMEPPPLAGRNRRSTGRPASLWETHDPRGIPVRLTVQSWHHIRRRHAEIRHPDQIRLVIEEAECILVDRRDPTMHHFYSYGACRDYPRLYLHAVVSYEQSGPQLVAQIKTAFLTDTLVDGELRWLYVHRTV